MKFPPWSQLAHLPIVFSFGATLFSAQPAPDAAGYWEGVITLPSTELAIKVDLTKDAEQPWRGTIDIPRQGFRGFKLDSVSVDGAKVAFALGGVPGEPRFAGTLAADGGSITGDFMQGTATMPFKLERKPRPPKAPEEAPIIGVPGQGFAGRWRGLLKPGPNIELRIALEVTKDSAGKFEGALISLDQGDARIPMTTLTATDASVHFEAGSVNGVFDGKFNPDGSELAGEWSQGGRTSPLVFKRLARNAATGVAAPQK